MGELDVDLSSDLVEQVRQLAVRHYGDASDASISRVVEVALEMRLLWQGQANVSSNDIEEPVANWEFSDAGRPANERLPHDLEGWLFRRRKDASDERSH